MSILEEVHAQSSASSSVLTAPPACLFLPYFLLSCAKSKGYGCPGPRFKPCLLPWHWPRTTCSWVMLPDLSGQRRIMYITLNNFAKIFPHFGKVYIVISLSPFYLLMNAPLASIAEPQAYCVEKTLSSLDSNLHSHATKIWYYLLDHLHHVIFINSPSLYLLSKFGSMAYTHLRL